MTDAAIPSTNRVIVDGVDADAMACARLLASEGHQVTMLGDRSSEQAHALAALGVTVDDEPAATSGSTLVVDCWTGETTSLVRRHRAAGAHVTSIGDLILERTRAHTLGVTGSGGKTTATRTAVEMMRAGNCSAIVSTGARADNAWPTAALIADVHRPEPEDWLALELTSTHLAYMHTSPDVAVITAWWPDHIELHGSVERYREAKATILRHQSSNGVCVVNADDPGAVGFADDARGRVFEASAQRPVAAGVGVEHGVVVARMDGGDTRLCRRDQIPLAPPLVAVTLAAACAALACGAQPDGVARLLVDPTPLAFRGREHGRIGSVAMVDASAATTPRKAIGALAGLDPSRVVLLAGGETEVNGLPVQASAPEVAELTDAVRALASCRAIIAFGPAAARLSATIAVATLSEAVAVALTRARPGDTILLAPMFPLSMEERSAFATLAGGGSTTVRP